MVSQESQKKPVDITLSFTIENNIIKGTERPIEAKCYNIGKIVLNNFNKDLNHVAQIDAETGKTTTYEEMKDCSTRCALWLQKKGIGSGDVVAICTHNQRDAYIPCIATFCVSAIYNPWHHEVNLKSAQHLMSLTRPKIIFACESTVNVLKEAAALEKVNTKIVVFGKNPDGDSLRDILRLQTNEEVRTFQPVEVADPQSIAMILFSSGTTGLPKGVAHCYKSLYKNIVNFLRLSTKACISLWYSSLYWISGSFCMLQSLLTDATRIMHDSFDPEETCKVIEKYEINWFFITPSMLTIMCKSNMLKKYKLNSLMAVTTGGAKLGGDVFEQFRSSIPHANVAQGFGMTEIGGLCTLQTKQCKSIDSVGFVAPNMQLKIIDVDTNNILGANEQGELCVKSGTMMVGYYRNPAATKAAIDEEGWLHTGDKAYYAENGELFIVDRLKEVMKFRGHHVSPTEVEEVLINHPSVLEVGVVAVPHDLDIERPMAFVTICPGTGVTADELIELSKTQLGENKKLWGGVQFLKEMPYTASGKISRKDLREMAKAYAT